MLRKMVVIAALLVMNTLAFGKGLTFSENESPYETIDRAFKAGRPVQFKDIPTKNDFSTKKKYYSAVRKTILEGITIKDILEYPVDYIVGVTKYSVVPGKPSRGPLFPGTPDTVREEQYFYTYDYVDYTDQGLVETASFQIDLAHEAWVTFSTGKQYELRQYKNVVIWRDPTGGYRYGWIENAK